MIQEINLYQDIFREKKVILTLRDMLSISAIIIFGLVVVTFVSQRQVTNQEQQLVKLQTQKDLATLQMEQVQASMKKPVKSPLLASQLAKLSGDINQQRQLLANLKPVLEDAKGGFASYLNGFSEQHVSGTWITDMDISTAGKQLNLKGNALQAELVTQYLKKLANVPVLSGTGFKVFSLSRLPLPEQGVQFVMQTQTEDK